MNLSQMADSVARKSYYSRTAQEVIEAINSGSSYIFNWILKEQNGWFLKFDYSQVFVPPVVVPGGAMTGGSPQLTSATANFQATDQGTGIFVAGAGPDGVPLGANILTVVSPTTVTLSQNAVATVANAQVTFRGTEYKLQPDVERIVRIREQDPTSGNWRIVHSTDFDDISREQSLYAQAFAGGSSGSWTDSPFEYYGPYEKDDGQFYIQIEPQADMNRPLEICYNAQYVEVQSTGDYYMLPNEFRDAAKDFAIAECLENTDDDLGDKIRARGEQKMNAALVIWRQKQISDPPKVGQYLSDEYSGDDGWPYIPGSP